MDDRVQAAINYFARENHSNVIFNVCSDALVARPHDPLLRFWRAFALVRQGNTNDALRELEPLQSIPDVSIAATAAAIAAHEMGSVRDEEAIMELETRLEIEEAGATDRPAINAATFYWHNGATERARAMVERALSLGNYNRQASTLMAWVLLSQHKADLELGLAEESDVEEALSLFQTVLQEAPADLEALLGKAEVLRWQGRVNEALDALALAHVKHPWFLPVLAEKAKLMMMRNEWERIMECVIHVGSVDESNPTAAGVAPQMSAFAAINSQVREGNNGAAAKHAKDILAGLDAQEPRNAVLFLSYSRLLARIACGDRAILEQSLALAQRAARCGQGHPQYGLELAVQHIMIGQLASARQALLAGQEVAGELQMAFALALIECQLQSGEEQDMEAAASALEVYSEMSSSASEAERAWLAFLQALLAQRKQLPPDSASKLFEVATRLQLALINDQPVDFSFFVQLNPSRVVQLLSMMLDLAGNEPRGATEAASPLIGKAMTALSILHRHCPGLLAAQMLTARAHYLSADFEPAMRVLSDIVHSSDNVCEAHLMMASIYLHQDRPELAQQALDQAMSANFEVRDSAAFLALLGQTQLAKGRAEEAKQTLERAMTLPGVRTALPVEQQSFSASWKQPNLQQRAAIYLQLAQAEQQLSHLEEAPEAAKLLKEAEALFRGTSEEVKVLIAICEQAISGKHDVEGALKQLRKIKPDSPFFTKVRVAMANIYLKHRNDKRAYAACYADLADNFPSFETFCMLGEAFLQIQEPAKAVEAFDAARERGAGRESALLSKIGKALIATHEYSRAVDYYAKAIVNNPSSLDLQLDLAELHLRLRQWPRALERLQKCLQQLQHDNVLSMGQLARLKLEVQILLSMAKVSQAQELPEKRLELLQAAAQKQRAILPHMSGEGPDAILEQKERTAAIYYSIGDHHRELGRLEDAMAAFKQAVQMREDHTQSMLALARVYLASGDLDNCQDMCATLQRIDPSNEEAAMMLSELMFHREHFESAIYHSEQLLERTPANWRALAHLVQQLRRAGRLKDAPECLERTRAKVPTAAQSPGFSFCVGLHQRFCNEPQEALQAFNHARADPDFQVEAVYNMVEIYINPDNDAVWQETKESEMDEIQNEEARLAARKLLDSIRRQAGGQVRFQVLECYAQMSSRQPADAEAAVSKLLDLASADPNAIPVLLALSTGFMLLNQTPKARNQLKRMQKMTMKPEHAEELERAWLLLAELFVQGGKYDLAQDLCTRCLKYNQSCAKAWEMQGQIWEKEQAYKDAADAYEKAWELENHAQAGVGYKLAFNYLKAQRYVEAIDISRAVLKQFPDYPKIGTEVLQKAQASIRV